MKKMKGILGLTFLLGSQAFADFTDVQLRDALFDEGVSAVIAQQTVTSMNKNIPSWRTWSEFHRVTAYANVVAHTPVGA